MKNTAYLAAIGILAVVVAVLGYKLSQKTDVVELQTTQISELDLERNNLMQELEIMQLRYDTMETDNAVLRAELSGQMEALEDLRGKLKDRNYSLSKARKEAETLRSIMKGYIVTIDSLNQMNIALMAERDLMAQEVSQTRETNQQLRNNLDRQDEIIKEGQILQTGEFATQAIYLRSSGKQVETRKARKTEMIKSCFTIRENRIARSGEKKLIMQIIAPDGSVLPTTNGAAEATLAGETQQYSVQRAIDYNNQEMEVCIFYTINNELAEGDYTLQVYEGGAYIGKSTLSLR